MKLSKKDKAFRTNKISYVDYKLVEMDRVLTNLFARLKYNGAPSKLHAKPMTLGLYHDEFLDPKNRHWFKHFQDAPTTVGKWIETHLVDLVNRGKANEVVASPRPLHGNTYLFRNPKYCRDYGVSQQVYELLYQAGNGQAALSLLKQFFFKGVNTTTGQYDNQAEVDVETQALLRLSDQVKSDAPDTSALSERYKPLIQPAADVFAEDVVRLLTYKQYIPRSVMVDYIKVLMAFHLGLYQLRLMKLLPTLFRSKGGQIDEVEKSKVGLYVDVTGARNSRSVDLARSSAGLHFKRIPAFIKSHFAVKKLDEFAETLSKKGKLPGSKTIAKMPVAELLKLLESPFAQERNIFFGQRNSAILDASISALNDQEDIPPEIHSIAKLGLSEFETYMEILLFVQGNAIRSGMVKSLDSLMLKNKPGALLRQPRGKTAERYFVLDSRLLEVLLQLAVLKPGGHLGFHTSELRIDELLSFLTQRYGLHIDSLPDTDGFIDETITVRKTLRENLVGFKRRLREIGFYKDLSDAYISQTVSPRYMISQHAAEPGDEDIA